MKTILIPVFCLLGFTLVVNAQTELKFNKLDSVFAYADKNSSVIKNNYQQTLLAKYQKIAALAKVETQKS